MAPGATRWENRNPALKEKVDQLLKENYQLRTQLENRSEGQYQLRKEIDQLKEEFEARHLKHLEALRHIEKLLELLTLSSSEEKYVPEYRVNRDEGSFDYATCRYPESKTTLQNAETFLQYRQDRISQYKKMRRVVKIARTVADTSNYIDKLHGWEANPSQIERLQDAISKLDEESEVE